MLSKIKHLSNHLDSEVRIYWFRSIWKSYQRIVSNHERCFWVANFRVNRDRHLSLFNVFFQTDFKSGPQNWSLIRIYFSYSGLKERNEQIDKLWLNQTINRRNYKLISYHSNLKLHSSPRKHLHNRKRLQRPDHSRRPQHF